jgi:hypothetical protein
MPGSTVSFTKPSLLAAAPFADGSPTVTLVEDCTGGLQDGNAKGGPWFRLGAVHALNAGTRVTRNGLAAFGRTWPALAIEATTITATAEVAKANGSTILFLMLITPPSKVDVPKLAAMNRTSAHQID